MHANTIIVFGDKGSGRKAFARSFLPNEIGKKFSDEHGTWYIGVTCSVLVGGDKISDSQILSAKSVWMLPDSVYNSHNAVLLERLVRLTESAQPKIQLWILRNNPALYNDALGTNVPDS